jgi:hypothetical protein
MTAIKAMTAATAATRTLAFGLSSIIPVILTLLVELFTT